MQARHQDRQTRVTPPERYRPPRGRSESPRAVRRAQARAVRVGEAAGMVEANLKRLVVVQRVPERTRRDATRVSEYGSCRPSEWYQSIEHARRRKFRVS
jgi:hypothetical protein